MRLPCSAACPKRAPACPAPGAQNRYPIHGCGVSAIDLSADGELAVSGGLDGAIVVWSTTTGFTLQRFTLHCAGVRSLRFSGDAAAVAACDAAGVVSGWDVRRGALLAAAPAHEGSAADCRWAPGGGALVSAGYDGHVALLRVSARSAPHPTACACMRVCRRRTPQDLPFSAWRASAATATATG